MELSWMSGSLNWGTPSVAQAPTIRAVPSEMYRRARMAFSPRDSGLSDGDVIWSRMRLLILRVSVLLLLPPFQPLSYFLLEPELPGLIEDTSRQLTWQI